MGRLAVQLMTAELIHTHMLASVGDSLMCVCVCVSCGLWEHIGHLHSVVFVVLLTDRQVGGGH